MSTLYARAWPPIGTARAHLIVVHGYAEHCGRYAPLALAMNELFVPLLQRQFPEVTDFYLPPEGCSYRMALVQIKKAYPGHARRVMMGVWSHLRQFMYTKFIVVVDEDIDIRDWKEVVWAITTRMDPVRDTKSISVGKMS